MLRYLRVVEGPSILSAARGHCTEKSDYGDGGHIALMLVRHEEIIEVVVDVQDGVLSRQPLSGVH